MLQPSPKANDLEPCIQLLFKCLTQKPKLSRKLGLLYDCLPSLKVYPEKWAKSIYIPPCI